MNKSILYYTGNAKHPEFEKRVQQTLVENCQGLPIISVSHKPLDLGKNICVGEVGHSYLNAFRQILIGAQAAETEWLIFAEDDFIYPPEYFQFNPSDENLYRYDNVWMVYRRGGWFYKTPPISGAQIAKRDYVVQEFTSYLEGQPEWFDGEHRGPSTTYRLLLLVDDPNIKTFTGPPAIVFKTVGNLSRAGSIGGMLARHIPIWGHVGELRRRYCVRA